MKVLKYISIGLMAGLALWSCSSDLKEYKVGENPQAPVLANHEPIVVTLENIKETNTFEWTKADFGYSAAIEYSLYGKIGEGEASRIFSSDELLKEITNEDLNNWLLGAGATPMEATDVTMYLMASISSVYPGVKSNEVSVKMTGTYTEKVVYVPGNHQGWNPAEAPKLFDVEFNDTYEGMLALFPPNAEAPAFKITLGPNWDNAIGGTLANLSSTGDNITELAAGFYRFVFDQKKMSATATEIESISLIGSVVAGAAADWDESDPHLLTMDETNNYLWKFTGEFKAGSMKFRINKSWDNALGGSMDDVRAGGGDISFSQSGNYTLVLDMSVFPYSVRLE